MSTILTPLLGAAITAGMVFAVVWVWAIALKFAPAWLPAVLVGSLAGLVFWLSAHARAVKISELEKGIQADPPPQPPEAKESATVRVMLSTDDGHAVDWIDLPATRKQLEKLAAGLERGLPFTVSAWSGAGRPFSRSEFEGLRAELLRRGLATWRNPGSPGQGATLTRAGKAVMVRLSGPTPTG